MWKDFEEKRSCKYSPPAWISSRDRQVSSYSWQYMPLPSRGQSNVCSWREFGLTNKSAKWNMVLEVSNSRRRRTRFTPVGLPYGRIFSQVFYNKKWSCDHLGAFVWREIYLALWKHDFYDVSLLPIVTRELFVKLVLWEQLWEWNELTGLPLRSKGGTAPTEIA